jgi:hypothetical protein
VTDLLNNALNIGPFPYTGLGIGGRTLIFSTPSTTVTFPGANGAMVSLADIITALLGGVSGLHVERRQLQDGSGSPGFYLALWRDGGVVLTKDGTANAAFGFSAAGNTTVKSPLASGAVKSVARTAQDKYEVIVAGLDADFDNPNADGSSSTPGGGGGGGNVVVP